MTVICCCEVMEKILIKSDDGRQIISRKEKLIPTHSSSMTRVAAAYSHLGNHGAKGNGWVTRAAAITTWCLLILFFPRTEYEKIVINMHATNYSSEMYKWILKNLHAWTPKKVFIAGPSLILWGMEGQMLGGRNAMARIHIRPLQCLWQRESRLCQVIPQDCATKFFWHIFAPRGYRIHSNRLFVMDEAMTKFPCTCCHDKQAKG